MTNEVKRWALVRAGVVENILLWDGASGEEWVAPRLADLPPEKEGDAPTPQYMEKPEDWVPFSKSFGDGAQLVQLSTSAPVGPGWLVASDGTMSAPEVPVVPKTAAEILGQRDNILAIVAVRIAPLQDAVDLGEATPEEQAQLTAWKKYRVALNRIQLQPGFPTSVDWPLEPTV